MSRKDEIIHRMRSYRKGPNFRLLGIDRGGAGGRFDEHGKVEPAALCHAVTTLMVTSMLPRVAFE